MKSALFRSCIAVLACSLLSQPVIAENLSEIFYMAQRHDPEWAAKKQEYLASREKITQALSALLPTASVSGSWGKRFYESDQQSFGGISELLNCVLDSSGSTIEDYLQYCSQPVSVSEDFEARIYNVNISQPLLNMPAWYSLQQAKTADEAAKSQLAFDQQELMIRVAEAYFTVLRAQEESSLAQSEVQTLKTQLDEIKNRYRLGLARETDLFEIQAQYDIAKAAVIAASSQVEVLKENLAILTGEYIEEVAPLPEDIPVEAPQPEDRTAWEDLARDNNYQLIAAQYAVLAAEKAVKSTKAGHAPTINFFYQYSNTDVGGGFIPASEQTTIGVNLTLPIYTGGMVSSAVKQAQYTANQTRYQAELAMRGAIAETRRYYIQTLSDVASVKARTRAVRSNNSSFKAVKDSWQDGIRTLTDTLQAQRSVYQARKELTTARYDYILNTLKLKKAAGILEPSDLESINALLDTTGNDGVNVIQPEDLERDPLDSVDTVSFKRDLRTFEDDKKLEEQSERSLFDAFKAWRERQ